jgi:ABC-2 type transport system permease protein
MAFYAAIIAITLSDTKELKKIAILDKAGLFKGEQPATEDNYQFIMLDEKEERSFKKKIGDGGFDAVLSISPFSLDSTGKFNVYSESRLDISTLADLENKISQAIIHRKLQRMGMALETYQRLKPSVVLQNISLDEDVSSAKVAKVGAAVSFICGFLIYVLLMIYGTQVMRGVMEEKSSRISEVVISSVKPFHLMMGKILGIGAVGLTQFLIWLLLMIGLKGAVPLFFPQPMEAITAAGAESGDMILGELLPALESLPLIKIVTAFLFYFLGGYLTYSAMFAAIGSMVGEDQQDSQQLVFPVIMPIIVGFVIMSKAIEDPGSSLAVFGSYFPLTSPIVMMGRITADLPWWELLLSMTLLAATFVFFAWLAGKIYRVGILMYGKKPSWKESLKWIFRK